LLKFSVEKRFPAFPELVKILVEMTDGVSYESRAASSKEGFGCGIRFPANGLVVQDENGVECIFNYRLEFALGGCESTLKLTSLLLSPKQEFREQDYNRCKGR
jgi:hypothetical protein